MMKKRRWYQQKRFLLIELLALFILPLMIVDHFEAVGILRHLVLSGVSLYFIWLLNLHKLTLKDLGLVKKNLAIAGEITVVLSLLVGLVTLVVIGLVPVTKEAGLHRLKALPVSLPWLMVGYGLVSVPLQELVFRGIVINRLEMVSRSRWLSVGGSALIFAFSHWIFHSWALVGFCLMAGLVWGYIFTKYRNLWPIQASHAILGGVFIYLVLA